MKLLGSLVAAAVVIGATVPASAEFFGWQVAGIGSQDVLMVRAAPASDAAILVGYPVGTPLSLTGKCSGGLNLDTINGLPAKTQVAAVRLRWCEVWVDPIANGNFQSGWVYGKYIAPL